MFNKITLELNNNYELIEFNRFKCLLVHYVLMAYKNERYLTC